MRQIASLDLDRFVLVVDPDADPFDEDGFLDALDRLVERRLSKRSTADSGGPSAAEGQSTNGDGDRAA